jgi:hypothetical protein
MEAEREKSRVFLLRHELAGLWRMSPRKLVFRISPLSSRLEWKSRHTDKPSHTTVLLNGR